MGQNSEAAARGLSHLKIAVRTSYSNPPAHGSAIVAEILADVSLRTHWEDEVAQMRARINGMRRLFVDTLAKKGAQRDFSFIARQRGMFSYSGLSDEQVEETARGVRYLHCRRRTHKRSRYDGRQYERALHRYCFCALTKIRLIPVDTGVERGVISLSCMNWPYRLKTVRGATLPPPCLARGT